MSAPLPSVDPARGVRWTDEQVDQVIGRVLQGGVLIAAVVVALGGVAFFARHGHGPEDFRAFRPERSSLRSIWSIVGAALSLDSRAIVQLGLVLLIVTPVVRVALTLAAFVIQRDRIYVAVTTVVLALLLYGLLWGPA